MRITCFFQEISSLKHGLKERLLKLMTFKLTITLMYNSYTYLLYVVAYFY
jgi:hypothetical protein